MNEHEAAAAAVLADFQPIGDDHPRVREFEDAIVEHVARRPSPSAEPVDLAARVASVEAKLDEVLSILRGGPQ